MHLESAIERGGVYDRFGRLEGADRRTSGNLQNLIRATKSFHSGASTAIEGPRSTIYNPSVMGEPLNERQQRNIIDWKERIEEVEEDEIRMYTPTQTPVLSC